MSVNDFKKALTAEDVIRRYNLNNLSSDRKKIKQNAETLVKTDKELKDFINITTKDIENIQSQVDGNITTWFFIGVPTIENEPANEWLTDKDKNNHLGDLYYDQDTGYAYRFALENNNYKWLKIVDSDVTEALALANSAKDTADSKRRVFVVLPTPPYDVGDIWIKDDKDLYRCRAKRIEGNYNAVDWVLATDYSNDDYAKSVEAVLNQFKTTVEKDYVTNVKLETTKDSIESSVSSVTTKVEKVENDMGDVISTVTSQNEKISKITQTTDEINSKISDIADITTSGESQQASVNLIKVNESEPIAIKIHPTTEDISYLYPSNYLYPSDDLYLNNRIIRFTNTDTNEVFDYELPDDLLYYDANNYDEFILNYDSQTCSVIKRVEYIKETNKNAIKITEETINYGFPTIALSAGNYTVSLPGYSNAYIYVQLMASNIYTTQFATKAELSSSISQTAKEINIEVEEKVGKEEVIARINLTKETATIQASKVNISGVINAINNNTSTTINGNKITTGTITADKVSSDIITTSNFSAQNINAEKITTGVLNADRIPNISADKINVTNLSSISSNLGNISGGNLNIGDGKFLVTNDGVLTATSGTIGGWTLSKNTLKNSSGTGTTALNSNGRLSFSNGSYFFGVGNGSEHPVASSLSSHSVNYWTNLSVSGKTNSSTWIGGSGIYGSYLSLLCAQGQSIAIGRASGTGDATSINPNGSLRYSSTTGDWTMRTDNGGIYLRSVSGGLNIYGSYDNNTGYHAGRSGKFPYQHGYLYFVNGIFVGRGTS